MADNTRAQKERNPDQRGQDRGKGLEPTRSNTPGRKEEGKPEGRHSNERMDTPRKAEERSRGGAGSSGTVQEYSEKNRDRGTGDARGEDTGRGERGGGKGGGEQRRRNE